MKQTSLLIMLTFLSIKGYSQSRYETVYTSNFVPLNNTEIQQYAKSKHKQLNRNIAELLEVCDYHLANPDYCYGAFRETIISIKKRLDNVNYRSQSEFISLKEVERIYNKCNKDYYRSTKKHNKTKKS